MSAVEFEWDPWKARKNEAKHGVSFWEAMTAFSDPMGLRQPDPDHSAMEDRYVLIARGSSLGTLVISHTHRRYPDGIRIISARKATCREKFEYERRCGEGRI